jgi:hypothetical protein
MFNNHPLIVSNEQSKESDQEPVNWEEVRARVNYRHELMNLPNVQLFRAQKWMGLKTLGCSDEACERLCRPEEIDRKEVERRVEALSLEHQKELRKLGLQKSNCKKRRKSNKDSDICVVG